MYTYTFMHIRFVLLRTVDLESRQRIEISNRFMLL